MNTELLKEVATQYENNSLLDELNELDKNKNTLKIALLGRFSSGKSSFINSLLNINYLPIKDEEATSKITFIEYGEEDRAFKILDNGSIVNIDLKIFKNITANMDEAELNKISFLKLELNNDLLKGITIIDTPGISGLNENTKNIAYNYLPKIDFAIYTTFYTGFNTDDLDFLELAKKDLKHIMPVINKADLVKSDSDVTFSTYEKDWDKLFDVEKLHPLFLYSSYENDFKYKDKGNQELKQYFFSLIENKKETLKQESIDKKVNKIKDQLLLELRNRRQLLDILEEDKDFNIKLLNLEKDLSNLNLKKTENHVLVTNLLMDNNKKFFDNEFENIIISNKKLLKHKVEEADIKLLRKEFKKILEVCLKESSELTISKWNTITIDSINPIIKDIGEEIQKDLNKIMNQNLSSSMNFSIPEINVDQPLIEELVIPQDSKKHELKLLIQSLEQKLKEENINIDALIEDKNTLEKQLANQSDDVKLVLNQMRTVEQYEPVYKEIIEQGGGENGRFIGKILGEVADWGMIFLPGTQIKLVEPLMKVGKFVGASQKVIEKAKSVENSINKVKKMSNDIYSKLDRNKRVNQSETFKKFSDVMSNFTLSTWGERLGGTIGEIISPTTVNKIVDPEWEEQQKRSLMILQDELNQANSDLNKKFENTLEKEKIINKLNFQINDLSKKLNEYHEMIRKIELEENNMKLTENAKNEKYLLSLMISIDEAFSKLKKEIKVMLKDSSENLCDNLLTKINNEVNKQISSIKEIIQSTNNLLNSSIQEKNTRIKTLDNYIDKLK